MSDLGENIRICIRVSTKKHLLIRKSALTHTRNCQNCDSTESISRAPKIQTFKSEPHLVFTQITTPHVYYRKELPPEYELYYVILATFVVTTLVPFLALAVLNAVIYVRLTAFRRVSGRLGREARKTVRATASLLVIVLMFLGCQSFKLIINGYQVFEVGT